MATIFHESTGLASIADDKPVRLTIPKFPNGTLLITKISGGVQPNYQILYSLGSDVFITAFNQRLSPWNISGIHIPGSCNKGAQDFNGEPAFVDLYRKFNIRTAKQPLDMAFNDIVVTGFFIGMTVGDYSQNGIDGYTWETTFLGRMTNLLENPDPIVVAKGDAVGAAVQEPVKEANLKREGEKKDDGFEPDPNASAHENAYKLREHRTRKELEKQGAPKKLGDDKVYPREGGGTFFPEN